MGEEHPGRPTPGSAPDTTSESGRAAPVQPAAEQSGTDRLGTNRADADQLGAGMQAVNRPENDQGRDPVGNTSISTPITQETHTGSATATQGMNTNLDPHVQGGPTTGADRAAADEIIDQKTRGQDE